jgi:putative ABC transport system permease protein
MLLAHRLRTVLSLLGIIVGIATVNIMAAVGRGSEEKVMAGIRRMGTNLIVVSAGRVSLVAGRTRQSAVVTTLRVEDAEAVARGFEDAVLHAAPAQSKKLPVKFENIAMTTNIVGTTAEILPIRNLRMQEGRMFEEQDQRALRRVAVVGRTVGRDMFGGVTPVGQTIRIGNVPFEVIGALAEAGMDINGVDQDDQILIPLRTALRRVFNVTHLGNIFVQVRDETMMEQTADRLRELLRERHRLPADRPDDFTIQNQLELMRAQRETQLAFRNMTVGVASLSLAVGGVGILAVMLMSVRERMKEIGLRRALGARRSDVLLQFLLEAMMLSVSGGMIGIVLGAAGTYVVAWLGGCRRCWTVKSWAWPRLPRRPSACCSARSRRAWLPRRIRSIPCAPSKISRRKLRPATVFACRGV